MKTLFIIAAIAFASPANAYDYDRDMAEIYQQQAGVDARFMDLAAQQDRMRMLQQNDELIRIQREILRRSRQR